MSSNYRSGGGGGYQYRGRGGYGGGGYRGGGRGGYKPRRYWDRDDDDYHRRSRSRDRNRDRGRDRGRSRSRSKSKSGSRSRSGSRSDSRSRSGSRGRDRDHSRSRDRDVVKDQTSPRRSVEYQPKPAPPAPQFQNTTIQMNEQFEGAYVPAAIAQKRESWQSTDLPSPYMKQQQMSNSQNGQIGGIPPPSTAQYTVEQYQQMQYQMANYQKQQQLEHAQVEAYKIVSANANAPVASGYGIGYGDQPLGFQTQKQQLPDTLYQSMPSSQPVYPPPAPVISKSVDETSVASSKKKKDSKKKKRRRKSSSSSSSSSSSDSESDSNSRSKNKRKSRSKRDSDDSSDSSSEDDKKAKEKPGGLTAQQRGVLLKQGEAYKKKLEILEREIKRLRTKEDELALAKADMKLIEENLKLQAELKGRCKAVNIVLEKITTVLRGGNLEAKPKPVPPPPPKISQLKSSPPRTQQQVTLVSSPPLIKKVEPIRNLDYFDNGLHWCRLCNVFPETIQEMLDHLHSADHLAQVEQIGIDEKPWHKKNSLKESKPEPGAKKVPFRGIQFFTPVQGWYCRICSAWLGDPHCATEHLKSEDHSSHLSNFLEEHPDWESKWMNDREKARARSGLGPGVGGDPNRQRLKGGKYSFETDEAKGVGVRYQPGAHDFEDDENAKSIRVQMRNISKENETRSLAYASAATTAKITPNKDASVDEWMGKTQTQNISLDIDTQKFAEIVRQKHGAVKEKEKEKELALKKPVAVAVVPPPPNYSRGGRDSARDRDLESLRRNSDISKRQESRVELSFSARDRERDRERDRGNRGGRRRSRSKSREKSRERDSERTRRRERTRSKSREREREKESRPDVKEREHIRRLPIIGKMPLYKKPTIGVSKESESGKASKKTTPSSSMGEYGPTPLGKVGEDSTATNTGTLENAEESNMSENSLTGFGYSVNFDDGAAPPYENSGTVDPQNSNYQRSAKRGTEDVKPPGETAVPAAAAAAGPGGLPDDLQHALDIIYSGAGPKPSNIPFPPPGMVMSGEHMGMGLPPPPPPQNYEYQHPGYNYMGYEPYQNSFEGYVAVSEYGEGPPGVMEMPPENGQTVMMGKANSAEMYTEAMDMNMNSASYEPEPAAPGDDDFEDLRMLGIDVDDTSVVHLK